MERERYGRGGGGGGINRYPDVSGRTQQAPPPREDRGRGRSDRPASAPVAAQSVAGKKVCYAFQDLSTGFWVAGHEAIVSTLQANGVEVVELNGGKDANRQLEQISAHCLEGGNDLASAAAAFAARFSNGHAAEVHIRISPAWGQLRPEAQEVVYRVAQESLQNISRHSGATRVFLWLTSADKRFRLSVRDNGAGFGGRAGIRPTLDKPLSFGLAGMRERAELLGGTLDAAPTNTGFRVLLKVPA
jgi:hypothetical protein